MLSDDIHKITQSDISTTSGRTAPVVPIPQECAFFEHAARVTLRRPDDPRAPRWHFECHVCAAPYVVSVGLLEHGFARQWQRDGTGSLLARRARRLWAKGELLILDTEREVTARVQEQTHFEHRDDPHASADEE